MYTHPHSFLSFSSAPLSLQGLLDDSESAQDDMALVKETLHAYMQGDHEVRRREETWGSHYATWWCTVVYGGVQRVLYLCCMGWSVRPNTYSQAPYLTLISLFYSSFLPLLPIPGASGNKAVEPSGDPEHATQCNRGSPEHQEPSRRLPPPPHPDQAVNRPAEDHVGGGTGSPVGCGGRHKP